MTKKVRDNNHFLKKTKIGYIFVCINKYKKVRKGLSNETKENRTSSTGVDSKK